jgi:ABC-type nitrate/sulfonate/bicarbonate transport system ATPase subunit
MSDSLGALRAEQVSHRYGALPVLDGFHMDVGGGEFVAIVGPSGCGKTTLLNLLSGEDKPTAGRIRVEGVTRRVYQQDSLFPWLTVAENVRMGTRGLFPDKGGADQLAAMLALIGMEAFAGHYPHQLSGGMRQRAELARALVGNADILLMDEPFSSLDYQSRLRMRRELARILARRPCTVVFVTHDVEEAAQLADRILVLSERPARIRCELRVDLPRPRDTTHPLVVETVRRILSELGLEDPERDAASAEAAA